MKMCGCADVRMCRCADVRMLQCDDVPMCKCDNLGKLFVFYLRYNYNTNNCKP
jgi:hypothetical protein